MKALFVSNIKLVKMSNVIITTGRKYALRKMVYKILDEKNTL
jgi:hypothetical protein